MSDLPSYIHEVFGTAGVLAQKRTGYAMRPGQIEMADLVDQMYDEGGVAVVEAPCGVGKSFAYLVPAIHHAVHSGVRTVIATANKKLQHQLIDTDLPALQRMLPYDFTYRLAKGKTNYVCNYNASESLGDVPKEVQRWVLETDTGDFQEMDARESVVVDARRRLALAVADDCLGSSCIYVPKSVDDPREAERLESVEDRHEGLMEAFEEKHGSSMCRDCFPLRARKQLGHANVVVVNYHLLMVHYHVQQLTDGHVSLLPPFGALICDEAHNLADTARNCMGIELKLNSFLYLNRRDEALRQAAGALFNHLEELRINSVKYKTDTLWLQGDLDEKHWKPLHTIVKTTHSRLVALGENLTPKLRRQRHRYESALDRLESLISADGDDVQARYIEHDERRRSPVLGSKMIDVSGFLQRLWATPTCVLTSATLSAGEDFSHLLYETGLARVENLTANRVSSPFNFADNSLLYVDSTMPDPSQQREAWEEAVPRRIATLLNVNGGSAMCIFTSRKMMNRVQSVLHVMRPPFNVYTQGVDTTGNQRIFERFLADKNSVLLGVSSFREGADAPGDTCSLIVMDKIPFPPLSDPIMQALDRREQNSFVTQSLPRAAIAQKQGIGRLIRSVTDRGLVAILDPRLVTKRFGKPLMQSRPDGMPVTTDYERAVNFMRIGRG